MFSCSVDIRGIVMCSDFIKGVVARFSVCCVLRLLPLSLLNALQGITVGGLKVLFSVYTKEKGRPGMEGLVLVTYNQETSVTSTMHLSASALESQVRTCPSVAGRTLGAVWHPGCKLLDRIAPSNFSNDMVFVTHSGGRSHTYIFDALSFFSTDSFCVRRA